jgi:hypothetical protein
VGKWKKHREGDLPAVINNYNTGQKWWKNGVFIRSYGEHDDYYDYYHSEDASQNEDEDSQNEDSQNE